MRYLVIGLFIISFLAGVATWAVNRPADGRGGFVSALLSAMGVSQKEQTLRSKGNALVKGTSIGLSKARELMQETAKSQQGLMEDMDDQRRFLEDSNRQIANLSEMVRNLTERNNVDLMRVKEALADFDSQSRLLIENGRQLIKFNQDQMRTRQQTIHDLSLAILDSNISQNRFLQYTNESLKQRSAFIDKSGANVREIRAQTERLAERLRGLENNLIKKEDTQLISNLKEAEAKSDVLLENVKLKEQGLRDLKQQHENQAAVVKEKVNDFIVHNAQFFDDAQERMREQKRSSDERTRDQMLKLKEQRDW